MEPEEAIFLFFSKFLLRFAACKTHVFTSSCILTSLSWGMEMNHWESFKALVNTPRRIVITTHAKPDADALGSSLALAGYLKKKGHQVQVITPTDYPKFLSWMSGNEEVIVFNEVNPSLSAEAVSAADVIFCLDFSCLNRIEGFKDFVNRAIVPKVLVDHHLEPEHFAQFEYWDPAAAATCELIYQLIVKLGDEAFIDVPIGECLYAGIMTDTGSFRHPCTTPQVHLISAHLIEKGVDTNRIHRLIYDSNTEERLKFIGFALFNKLQVIKEFQTAYFAISSEELAEFHSQTGDTEGLVNYALSIEGIIFAAIMIDRQEMVKMSFRSVGNFSANEFAKKHFDGGGHKYAAGGKSYLPLEDTIRKFVDLLPQYEELAVHVII
jgi:phosphoesterase RecJ-like protein